MSPCYKLACYESVLLVGLLHMSSCDWPHLIDAQSQETQIIFKNGAPPYWQQFLGDLPDMMQAILWRLSTLQFPPKKVRIAVYVFMYLKYIHI